MPSPGEEIGRINRERVRDYMRDHIGATKQECGRALGLSAEAVGRHVVRIRNERSV